MHLCHWTFCFNSRIQFQVGLPIAYKGLVHTKDTKAGHTERFSILQQKNMEGCTQLIPRAGQPLEFFMDVFLDLRPCLLDTI